MRTGVPLSTLRREVMIEAGLSTDAGHAIATQEKITHLLNRTERLSYVRETWPVMQIEAQVTVAADAQFAALPSTITSTQIRTAEVLHGNIWLPMSHGISLADKSIYNEDQRSTPIQRYEIVSPGTAQFEVWPIGSVAQIVKFTGQKAIGEMVSDDDTCTLDADVLVLRVAAELLGRDRKEDAALKLDLAKSLTSDLLKLQGGVKDDPIDMTGRGRNMAPRLRPGIDFIPPGGNY